MRGDERTTEYDEIGGVTRQDDFYGWARRNHERYNVDFLAPDKVLYCSPACAILANPSNQWVETDLSSITTTDYDAWCEEAGPGNGPGALCPYCETAYHAF